MTELSEEKVFGNAVIEHYQELKTKNPSFSIRSFAKFLDVDQSFLSKVLKGKKGLSKRLFVKITNRLNFSADRVNSIIESTAGRLVYRSMENEFYNEANDWLCYAIVELGKTRAQGMTVKEIAEYFGATEVAVENVLSKLKKFNLVENENVSNWRVKTVSTLPQDFAKSSEARKRLQQQFLKLSYNSISRQDLGSRINLGLTISIPKDKFEQAKERLISFCSSFADEFQPNEQENTAKVNPDEVYQLCLSLFTLKGIGNDR